MTRPTRNAPCPCGSGRKWKRCCGSAEAFNAARAAQAAKVAALREETQSREDAPAELVEARGRGRRSAAVAMALAAMVGAPLPRGGR